MTKINIDCARNKREQKKRNDLQEWETFVNKAPNTIVLIGKKQDIYCI